MSPPMTTARPESTKPTKIMVLVRMPVRRAATGLAPIAYMERPNTVKRIASAVMITTRR